MSDDADLKFRQAAANNVEQTLKQVLIEFTPTQDLKVSDVLYIAGLAKRIAFDAFTKPE